MRWPGGRGEVPRQDGQCVHNWQRQAAGTYRCQHCGRQAAQCPHQWGWRPQDQVWVCTICGAVQAQER